jgi:hypothetical protein
VTSGTRLDRALDALGHKYRRRLLVGLLDHNPQDDDDAQRAETSLGDDLGEEVEVALIHSHLPKLEQAGYIAWDRESGEISKGPNWDEIAPLLQLLGDHADELPDDWL